ncbi:hypothetical protein OQA88_9916 [Cercophora sp. LCS_1]
MDEFDKQFDKVYAALVDGVPTSEPLVDGRPKDEVFASDFLRENPFLKENNNRPLAHIRFFYQAKENAVTRLRFGRDDYRPHQARAEWHKDDWVEMRYERDTHERDYPVGEHNRVWYSIDKTKWKNGSEDIKIEYVNKSHVAGAKDAMQLVRESEPPESKSTSPGMCIHWLTEGGTSHQSPHRL